MMLTLGISRDTCEGASSIPLVVDTLHFILIVDVHEMTKTT